MKKIVTLLVVLVLLLLVAPWGIGRLAEKRVNAGLDRLIVQAPYLSIVERKWTPGWFRSEQEVTFEVLGPWLKAMNPATVMDEIKKAEEGAAAEEEAGVEPLADVEEAPAMASAEAAPAVIEPLRFTVRNEILHGPVLWPASLGIARVNTKLVLSEETRKKLIENFGTDEPVRISTRVAFLGGGSTRFFGDGQDIKFKDGSGSVSYDDYELVISYSKNLDDFGVKGEVPRIVAEGDQGSAHFEMSGMSLVGESERVQGEVYDADYKFTIHKVRAVDADKKETSIEDIHYLVKTSVKDDFMDVSARLGTGKLRNPSLAELEFDVDEIHYDFTLRRLNIGKLDKLMAAIKAMYTRPVTTVADVDAAMIGAIKEHGLDLLKDDPEVVLDRIGIVTPQGEGVIKGVMRFKGLQEADLESGSLGWVNKFDGDFTIECAQKLIEKIPNGATGAGVAIDQGYAKREGDKLVSHIEYKQGQLKVNGKAQGIPGLGGPPGEADPVAAE